MSVAFAFTARTARAASMTLSSAPARTGVLSSAWYFSITANDAVAMALTAAALSGPLELEQCTKVEGAAQDQASGPAAAPAAMRPSAAARNAQRVLL
jgi:hypothetical protein